MPATLKSRTARSSLFLLRTNLQALRDYSHNFDPAEIDRVTKAAELVSTSLKKLQSWVAEEPSNAKTGKTVSTFDEIDVQAVVGFLTTLETGRLCSECGGILPSF